MSDLGLSIAASGVNADQTALDTIGQNLSNANTAGYVAETANLTTASAGDSLGIGGGVNVSSVTQDSDTLLQTSANQTAAGLAQVTALQTTLQEAQDAFPVSTTSGFSADLNSFWNSWDSVAADPTSQAGYLQVVTDASNLETDYTSATSQLAQASSNASSQLSSTISSVNTLLGQVASLNGQIQQSEGQGSAPNSLLDQQNQLMTQLATDIGATGSIQANGTVQVNVGGVTLVQGTSAGSLAVSDPPSSSNALSGTGTQITASLPTSGGGSVSVGTVSPSSGTVAGLLTAITTNLPNYQTQLNTVMGNLASAVNTQLAAGNNTSGVSEAANPLFTVTDTTNPTDPDPSDAGYSVGVNSYYTANPTDLAVASGSTTDDTDDGSNAQTIADLGTTAGVNSSYNQVVESIGNDVSSVTSQVTAQTSANNAAQQNLQSVTGVNQNEQLVALMNFQNSYQASAKVINTMDEVLQSLLQAV